MSTRAATADDLLPDVVTDLNIYIQWAEATTEVRKLAEQGERICELYRAMAICLFVTDGAVDAFFHWLLHSPLTLRFHLDKAKAAGLGESREARASFVDPLLDAIAARQWKLAGDIGGLMAPEWLDGSEYEDDFCYGDFLRRMVGGDDDLMPLLTRWQGVLQGGFDARLTVAKALAARDEADFEGGLRSMLQRKEAKAQAMANPKSRSPLASDLSFAPNRWVSVEGLALLAIAERRGIAVEDEIDYCPRSVRPGVYAPFRPLGYPNLSI